MHTQTVINKVVYNACFGGFSLSYKAVERLAELGYFKAIEEIKNGRRDDFLSDHYTFYDLPRHDRRLVQVVEELGNEANGICARLKVLEITSHMYRIDEYDGNESVQTPDTIDWIVID